MNLIYPKAEVGPPLVLVNICTANGERERFTELLVETLSTCWSQARKRKRVDEA